MQERKNWSKLPNIDKYVSFLVRHENMINFASKYEQKYISLRLLHLDKWLDYDLPDSITHLRYEQGFGDMVWSQLLELYQSDPFDPTRRLLLKSILGGIRAVDQYFADYSLQSLASTFLSACKKRRIVKACFEQWKFKAAHPGTKLYARIIKNVSEHFYTIAKI